MGRHCQLGETEWAGRRRLGSCESAVLELAQAAVAIRQTLAGPRNRKNR